MSWFAAGAAVVAVASEAVNMVQQKKIADQQAQYASQMANYNAQLDVANANQIAMNANANIQKQRTEDKSYLSSQRAAMAASGILSETGSPLALQATTAGRMEQDIQNDWAGVQEKETSLNLSAEAGIYEGAEESSMYHLEGAADIFKGIGSMASTFGSYAGSSSGQHLLGPSS